MSEKEIPNGFHYVGNCIRPPSEANSILLQATLGCSHSKCTFCGAYKDKRFAIKDRKHLESDLRFARHYCKRQDRVFVMDGDAFIMPMKHWKWLLGEIRDKLPWVRRTTCYANLKSIMLKSDEDLKWLYDNGLKAVFLGLESGHAQVRKDIRKGGTPEDLIHHCKRLRKSGIKLVSIVLLGLGQTHLSMEHARETGRALSEIDPEAVSALSLMPLRNTPLGEAYERGEFDMPDPLGIIRELRELVEHTNLSRGSFRSVHASNYLPIDAKFPRDKEAVLATLDQALAGNVQLKPEWMRGL
ncbi:radical SAM protein [Desulfatibacillum aliphaticivorans]|uniref:radical SAM protein n=1 Tax=Desulfatibacillum aliphaticivorans TaxID=218208 RepID=UPI000429D23C|nr:radical SAM protein [Desulfatibacillum aliphaticivorans]